MQATVNGEPFPAHLAFEVLIGAVRVHVLLKVASVVRCFSTHFTLEYLVLSYPPFPRIVNTEIGLTCTLVFLVLAFLRAFGAVVCVCVFGEVTFGPVRFSTQLA